jgi:hypothetical protein
LIRIGEAAAMDCENIKKSAANILINANTPSGKGAKAAR